MGRVRAHPEPGDNLTNTNPLKIILFLGLAAMVAGAFLPWTKIGPFSASGTEGDGLVATAAGSMLFFRILKVPGASALGNHA